MSAFGKINDAVTASANGDVIKVGPGTYNERVVLNKSLTLLGNQKGVDARTGRLQAIESIVDGSTLGGAISVKANNVTIDGFTVQGDASLVTGIDAAITTAEDTVNLTGLHVFNDIVQNTPVGISPSGDLVIIQHNLIRNTIDSADDSVVGNSGIDTERGLTNARIDSNKLVGNTDYSIHITSADPDPVNAANAAPNPLNSGNIISNNDMDSELDLTANFNAIISGNKVNNSWTGGITLGGWDDHITITGNLVLGVEEFFSAFRVKDYFALNGGKPRPNTNFTVSNNNFLGGALGNGMRVSLGSITTPLSLSYNQISGGGATILNEDTTFPIVSLGNDGNLTRATSAGTALLDSGVVTFQATPTAPMSWKTTANCGGRPARPGP